MRHSPFLLSATQAQTNILWLTWLSINDKKKVHSCYKQLQWKVIWTVCNRPVVLLRDCVCSKGERWNAIWPHPIGRAHAIAFSKYNFMLMLFRVRALLSITFHHQITPAWLLCRCGRCGSERATSRFDRPTAIDPRRPYCNISLPPPQQIKRPPCKSPVKKHYYVFITCNENNGTY